MQSRCLILMLVLTLGLAGCTDTPDSASREYRNAINESIDAMMLVTNEASAKRMYTRIFKGMGDRFTAIDRKWVIIESNRTKKDFIKEVLESDGVHLYLSELQINLDRFSVESIRLRKVYEDTIEREKDRLRDAGEDPEKVEPREVCASLHELIGSDAALKPLEEQLMRPKLIEKMASFREWKVKEYQQYFEAFKAKREGAFAPKVIQLRD